MKEHKKYCLYYYYKLYMHCKKCLSKYKILLWNNSDYSILYQWNYNLLKESVLSLTYLRLQPESLSLQGLWQSCVVEVTQQKDPSYSSEISLLYLRSCNISWFSLQDLIQLIFCSGTWYSKTCAMLFIVVLCNTLIYIYTEMSVLKK